MLLTDNIMLSVSNSLIYICLTVGGWSYIFINFQKHSSFQVVIFFADCQLPQGPAILKTRSAEASEAGVAIKFKLIKVKYIMEDRAHDQQNYRQAPAIATSKTVHTSRSRQC